MKARHVRYIERRASLALLERYDRELAGLRSKQGRQPRLIATISERRRLVAEILRRRGFHFVEVTEPQRSVALAAP